MKHAAQRIANEVKVTGMISSGPVRSILNHVDVHGQVRDSELIGVYLSTFLTTPILRRCRGGGPSAVRGRGRVPPVFVGS